MEKYEALKRNRKEIMMNNFLGGIAWAFGATIGFSLLLATLGFIATKVNVVPGIGQFISDIIDFVLQHNTSIK